MEVGFREGFLYAELESIPEELFDSVWWLFGSAEIVEGCLFGSEHVEELPNGCV